MTIEPVRSSVQVKAAPARAFEIFTTQTGLWWPKGATIGKQPHATIILEPHAGGKWFERDANGAETHWGKVLAWEPPSRLLLAWQINCDFGYDPDLLTEVELRFLPAEGGGTLVTLEHRDMERFGAEAARMAEKIRGGWPARLGDFATFANA